MIVGVASLSLLLRIKKEGDEFMSVQYSRLKQFSDKPGAICSQARHMFGDKRVCTVVVEGGNDKLMFENWLSGCRIHDCKGKRSVIEVYKHYKKNIKSYNTDASFMYFVVDLDFDLIYNDDLIEDECFIYNSFCRERSCNDMEAFLVSTPAFERVLSGYNIKGDSEVIRNKLRVASAVLGSFRAADFMIKREKCLSNSVLNGLEVCHFFNSRDIFVDPASVEKGVEGFSNYEGVYAENLIKTARRLRDDYIDGWGLSRGHDLTEMLSLFLKKRGRRRCEVWDVENMLRRECERCYFEAGPVGRRFFDMGFLR